MALQDIVFAPRPDTVDVQMTVTFSIDRQGVSRFVSRFVDALPLNASMQLEFAETRCAQCEAVPGDNDHCVFDGKPHAWHRCGGITAPDSNCPNHTNGSAT
jgi:hypothetical protein